jgi:excisionase family DNA binding protein
MNDLLFTPIRLNELETLIENSVRKALISKAEIHPSPDNELLTIEQAAEFLSLTKQTIYSLVSRGEIPSMKRSKRLYFSREDLISYVKKGRRKTNDEIAACADKYVIKRKRKWNQSKNFQNNLRAEEK